MFGDTSKGLFAVGTAGLFNGSFPAPSKGITNWKWEHIWIIYSICAMGLLPVGMTIVSSRGVIPRILVRHPGVSLLVMLCGALWGIGSLLFGVSLARLGMSITNAMVNGIVAFLGSVGPILIGVVHVDLGHLMRLFAGEGLLVLSLLICATASVRRERAQGKSMQRLGSDRESVIAILIAVSAGVLSSMLNIGFVFGMPLAEEAKASGCKNALIGLATWVPALLGALIFNVGYPALLISRNKSWQLFLGPEKVVLWFRSLLMGVLWFVSILLYGIGASSMGSDGAVYGWALIIAVSILTSNAWGALTDEWKDSGAGPKALMWVSTILLIASLAVLAGGKA